MFDLLVSLAQTSRSMIPKVDELLRRGVNKSIEMSIRIRRESNADGMILYVPGKKSGSFMSLSVRKGKIEFRYNFEAGRFIKPATKINNRN